jgi:flagella basal body P-ring formation protein FlgA
MEDGVRNPAQSLSQRHPPIAPAALAHAVALALVLNPAWTAMVADAQAATTGGLRDPAEVARAVVRQQLPDTAGSGTEVFIEAEPVDPRLRLGRCAHEPEGRLDSNAIAQGRALVRVTCRAPVAWSVFIPVRIESEAPVRVLRVNLPRGAPVAEDDAPSQRRRFSGLSENYVKSGEPLTGYRLRRPVTAGSVLARDALELAPVVHRGAQVTVRAESAGFRIETSGKALADAAPGQRVRVQQVTSLKVVEGVVDNAGIVRVSP